MPSPAMPGLLPSVMGMVTLSPRFADAYPAVNEAVSVAMAGVQSDRNTMTQSAADNLFNIKTPSPDFRTISLFYSIQYNLAGVNLLAHPILVDNFTPRHPLSLVLY
jgi:hypothetical protein